jgi:hypothetical protein
MMYRTSEDTSDRWGMDGMGGALADDGGATTNGDGTEANRSRGVQKIAGSVTKVRIQPRHPVWWRPFPESK